MHSPNPRAQPVILCLSGHDPTGGAGIQADIETLNQLGGHAASLISSFTVQDSKSLLESQAIDADLLRRQAAVLLADLPIDAIKLGALGSAANAAVAVEIIQQLREHSPKLPIVLDPVLSAGGGGPLADTSLIEQLRETLLPLCTVVTPNLAELERLTDIASNTATAAETLLNAGCQYLLVTGTDSETKDAATISHWLYSQHEAPQILHCKRLPGQYHGSGCTLAAALAFYLSQGLTVPNAAQAAQHYCWQSLADARAFGAGQLFPHRGPPRR